MRILRKKDFPAEPSTVGSGSHGESGMIQGIKPRLLGPFGPLKVLGGLAKGVKKKLAGGNDENQDGNSQGENNGGADTPGKPPDGPQGPPDKQSATQGPPPPTQTIDSTSTVNTETTFGIPPISTTLTTAESSTSRATIILNTPSASQTGTPSMASSSTTSSESSSTAINSSASGSSLGQSATTSSSPSQTSTTDTIPPSSYTSMIPQNTVPTVTPGGSAKSGLSSSAIGGIVAGVVIGIFLLMLIAFIVCFRRRRINVASRSLSFEKAFSYPFSSPNASAGATHNIGRPIRSPSAESSGECFHPSLMVGPGLSRSASTLSSLGRVFVATRRDPLGLATSEESSPSNVSRSTSATSSAARHGPCTSHWSTTHEGDMSFSEAVDSMGSLSEESSHTVTKPPPVAGLAAPAEKSRFSPETSVESSTSAASYLKPPGETSRFSQETSAASSESRPPENSRFSAATSTELTSARRDTFGNSHVPTEESFT